MLSDLGVAGNAFAGAAEGRNAQPSFAEGLGLWLDWTDAIALSAALNSDLPAGPAAVGPGTAQRPASAAATLAAPAVADALKRVRSDLMALATADVAYAAVGAPADAADDLSACRRDHLAHQRAMDAAIAPLRAQVRAALSRTTPEGARLAALDAVLDEALRPRERQLLAALPAWLEANLAQLAPPDGASVDGQALHHRYRSALQRVLLAELELRLEPVEGLIEALGHETRPTP